MNNIMIFAKKISRVNISEVFLTIPALPGEGAEQVAKRLNDYLYENPDSRVVQMMVFDSTDFIKRNNPFQDASVDTINWPITRVSSDDPGSYPMAGIQVHLVEDANVEPIKADGQVVGSVFEDSYARYCLLGNVLPDNVGAGKEEQAVQVFGKWKSALEQVGMGVCDIVRTWLFLDDILSWYDVLNKVRNDFFGKEGVYDRVVPASSGTDYEFDCDSAQNERVADLCGSLAIAMSCPGIWQLF